MKYQLHDMHYVCQVTTETMSTKKNRCSNKQEKISRCVEDYLWKRARKRRSDVERIEQKGTSGKQEEEKEKKRREREKEEERRR